MPRAQASKGSLAPSACSFPFNVKYNYVSAQQEDGLQDSNRGGWLSGRRPDGWQLRQRSAGRTSPGLLALGSWPQAAGRFTWPGPPGKLTPGCPGWEPHQLLLRPAMEADPLSSPSPTFPSSSACAATVRTERRGPHPESSARSGPGERPGLTEQHALRHVPVNAWPYFTSSGAPVCRRAAGGGAWPRSRVCPLALMAAGAAVGRGSMPGGPRLPHAPTVPLTSTQRPGFLPPRRLTSRGPKARLPQ